MSNHRASLSPDLRTGGVHSSNLGQIPNTPMTAAIEDQSPYDLSSNNGVDTQTSDQFSTDPYSFDPEAPMATSEDADDLANIQQQHAQAMLLQSQMLAQAQQRALLVGQAYGNDDVSPDAYAIQLESDLLQFQVFFFNVHKCVNFAKWFSITGVATAIPIRTATTNSGADACSGSVAADGATPATVSDHDTQHIFIMMMMKMMMMCHPAVA